MRRRSTGTTREYRHCPARECSQDPKREYTHDPKRRHDPECMVDPKRQHYPNREDGPDANMQHSRECRNGPKRQHGAKREHRRDPMRQIVGAVRARGVRQEDDDPEINVAQAGLGEVWHKPDERCFAAARPEVDLRPEPMRSRSGGGYPVHAESRSVCVVQCMEKTQRPSVTARCADGEKSKHGQVDIGRRRAARDFKPKADSYRFGVFASTPPWGATRLLFSLAAGLMNT